MALERLPHAYPFRLVDRLADGGGGVVVMITADAAQLRGGAELPGMLAVEVMAQAALMTLAPAEDGGGEAPRGGLLAGLDEVSFHAPLIAGDRVHASATVLARMGALVKVRCELRRGDELLVEGGLLLALEA